MKKVISQAITILAIATFEAVASENCSIPENPTGSCQLTGFVCNLGFNVVGENNMMFFNLGTDATCSNLLKSNKFPTKITPKDYTLSSFSNFTLIENEENMGPLSLTLASSLTMLAVNNNIPVDIIYKQVGPLYFNGIKLLSINLHNTNTLTNP